MTSVYLLTVAWMWAMATVSPGPNFVTIAQIGASQTRAAAVAAVVGTGVATVIWGLCGVAGMRALFIAAPWAFVALKLGGAAYLIFTGVRMFVRSFKDSAAQCDISTEARPMGQRRAFALGLATALANPRSALSVASVFAVALPGRPTIGGGMAAVGTMVAVSVGWYALLAFLFTTRPVADGYRRFGHWLDRVAGGLLVVLGLKLAIQTK